MGALVSKNSGKLTTYNRYCEIYSKKNRKICCHRRRKSLMSKSKQTGQVPSLLEKFKKGKSQVTTIIFPVLACH